MRKKSLTFGLGTGFAWSANENDSHSGNWLHFATIAFRNYCISQLLHFATIAQLRCAKVQSRKSIYFLRVRQSAKSKVNLNFTHL